MTARLRWMLIGRCLAGWHALGLEGRNTVSVTTYDVGPEPPEHLVREAEIGAWVYDASSADQAAVHRQVIAGPIPSPQVALDFEGEGLRSMSHVGVAVYVRELRRACPGTRVGRVLMHRDERVVQWEVLHGS
jgi:hypothetical protein